MNPDLAPDGEPVPPLIYTLESVTDRLDLGRLFARRQPMEVEIGSGDGSFLMQHAAAHPGRNFIAIERLLGRLRKLERKAARLGLANVRGLRVEAAYFLEYLLPAHSAEAIHIYFPDPWPKRKHHRHRLIDSRFPDLARKALAEGGVVYLRTDDEDYFKRMTKIFGASAFFEETPTPPALAAMLTDFERGFLARGVPARRAAYRLLKRQ